MKQYRIYIGGKFGKGHSNFGEEIPNFELTLQSLTMQHFKGATIFPATGIWEGALEPTCVVEVLTDSEVAVRTFADEAKDVFAQDSVMYTMQVVEQTFV